MQGVAGAFRAGFGAAGTEAAGVSLPLAAGSARPASEPGPGPAEPGLALALLLFATCTLRGMLRWCRRHLRTPGEVSLGSHTHIQHRIYSWQACAHRPIGRSRAAPRPTKKEERGPLRRAPHHRAMGLGSKGWGSVPYGPILAGEGG